MKLLQLLAPYNIKDSDSLVRLGRNGDGGYILTVDTIKNIDRCYSYGIANETSFEECLAKSNSNIEFHLYDHTVDYSPRMPKAAFHKEGLAGSKIKDCNSFWSHLDDNGDTSREILLKLDCEGAEYDFFLSSNFERFASLHSMIIEFHDIGKRTNDFKYIIDSLNKYFHIIHLHQNGYGGFSNIDGNSIGNVIEITFLNRGIYRDLKPKAVKYPIAGLDFANCAGIDHQLSFEF